MLTEEEKAKRRQKYHEGAAALRANPELHAAHKARERERSKRRYAANPEYYSAKNSRWFRSHRDWDNERHRRIHAADPEKSRAEQLRRVHRIRFTDVEWKELISRLRGPCEICGAAQNGQRKRMYIDHDHITNKFRGILCHRCNVALGYLDDDTKRLRKAADYLERAPEA